MDGFAGTGAVGLEALSRGADLVYFVETDAAAVKVIQANLARCDVGAGFQLLKQDTLAFLRDFTGDAADVLFLDPPYRFHGYRALLATVAAVTIH